MIMRFEFFVLIGVASVAVCLAGAKGWLRGEE